MIRRTEQLDCIFGFLKTVGDKSVDSLFKYFAVAVLIVGGYLFYTQIQGQQQQIALLQKRLDVMQYEMQRVRATSEVAATEASSAESQAQGATYAASDAARGAHIANDRADFALTEAGRARTTPIDTSIQQMLP